MSKKYPDLNSLLSAESQAREMFDKLPQYAKEMISSRAQSVNSVESLKDYIDNVTRGDN